MAPMESGRVRHLIRHLRVPPLFHAVRKNAGEKSSRNKPIPVLEPLSPRRGAWHGWVLRPHPPTAQPPHRAAVGDPRAAPLDHSRGRKPTCIPVYPATGQVWLPRSRIASCLSREPEPSSSIARSPLGSICGASPQFIVNDLLGGERMANSTLADDPPLESGIPTASLDSILCTEELRQRGWRPPDYEKENDA